MLTKNYHENKLNILINVISLMSHEMLLFSWVMYFFPLVVLASTYLRYRNGAHKHQREIIRDTLDFLTKSPPLAIGQVDFPYLLKSVRFFVLTFDVKSKYFFAIQLFPVIFKSTLEV